MFYGEKGLNLTSICPEMKLYGKDFFYYNKNIKFMEKEEDVMKKKKIAALFTALALLVSMTACGGQETATQGASESAGSGNGAAADMRRRQERKARGKRIRC